MWFCHFDNLIFVTFVLFWNLASFGAYILLKCIKDGTLCAQLLLQFYTDQFDTLQAFLSWFSDVQVILDLLLI